MNQSLPLLPGYSFRDYTKTSFGYPRTLVYSKGVPVPQPIFSASTRRAVELLDIQNKILDREQAAELTYGPKRSPPKAVELPKYLAMDKKVLRFSGYFREETHDWSKEEYRIRPVKVLYYLQDDTMEVIEPKIANSGLLQGTMFKRHAFPHPKGRGRTYLWKDLNLQTDLLVYSVVIHLTDCDQWTKEYLIDAGIELNEPEPIPPDPHQQEKLSTMPRKEIRARDTFNEKLYKFLTCDRKVLRFYGMWKDILNDPPEMRRVIVQYYLADDSMEVLEDHVRNCGRDPCKVLIRKQKLPVDRNELSESFPKSYLEIGDQDLTFFKPKDLMTGKDIVIFGKKIFLYDCDEFTRHYYKTHFGVEDMESIAVAEKPKPIAPRVFPPHTGIGDWEDSLQNCLSLIPKRPKKNILKELHFNGVILRYKAELITPLAYDKERRFTVTFYPNDDTVAINEDAIPNSGFPGGPFLKRNKLSKPDTGLALNPQFYEAKDFHIGAEIPASGKLFKLVDADKFVLHFMEQHPEIYPENLIEIHRRYTLEESLPSDAEIKEKNDLMRMMRDDVMKKFGSSPYPLPSFLEPACDLQHRQKMDEEFYSANMPISPELLKKVILFWLGIESWVLKQVKV
ncbi:EF-hand domain-containing protein 1 [Nephila pilipes]|uniref:EF-hand domain-containing protein 1 n=1 Tax=Nephila pilipes TaxID=299642 RepID=A0A8X6TPU8_NEPPI|nr:EF-hand domain-containing protein 1 [Nephila pilipes]